MTPQDTILARLADLQGAMVRLEMQTAASMQKLDLLCPAVLGNGKPEKSLLTRVTQLEKVASHQRGRIEKWIDRGWRLAVSVMLVVLAWKLNGM